MKGSVFIAARHGSYNDNKDLSPEGKAQMRRLAQRIKELNTRELPVILICSTAPRAQQGGAIIAEELNIPDSLATYHKCLWDDNFHCGDLTEAQRIIDDNFADNVILVALSHLDFVPFISSYVASKYGYKKRFGDSEYGQGFLITGEGSQAFPR